METTFSIIQVWDLGETIHLIGTVENGTIKGGETLRDTEGLEIEVDSVAIGRGDNLPPDAVTLVVSLLPRSTESLKGKTLSVCSANAEPPA